jgi:hypothetical protein
VKEVTHLQKIFFFIYFGSVIPLPKAYHADLKSLDIDQYIKLAMILPGQLLTTFFYHINRCTTPGS